MKKSISIAVMMAVVLFVIGYFFSIAGHDRSTHHGEEGYQEMHESAQEH